MENVAANLLLAIFASVVGIIIYEVVQYVVFTESLKDVGMGTYKVKGLVIEVREVAEDYVRILIQKNEQECVLKERENCYSDCFRITLLDIKNSVVNIEVEDDMVCNLKMVIDRWKESLTSVASKNNENTTKE